MDQQKQRYQQTRSPAMPRESVLRMSPHRSILANVPHCSAWRLKRRDAAA